MTHRKRLNCLAVLIVDALFIYSLPFSLTPIVPLRSFTGPRRSLRDMPLQNDMDGIEAGLSDLALLDFLTSPDLPVGKPGFKRRDADLDPLMLAAVYSAGPQVTRNHYAHDFFPAVGDPRAEGAYDWTKWKPEDSETAAMRRPRLKYVSRQEPRSQRVKREEEQKEREEQEKAARHGRDPLRPDESLPSSPLLTSQSTQTDSVGTSPRASSPASDVSASSTLVSSVTSSSPELEAKCMARTRVPTAHGPVFLHIYHNNRDNKEHLAVVVDPAQFLDPTPNSAPPIRSRSLDAVWSEKETEMDRITRGAYVGRLSATSIHPSAPSEPHGNAASGNVPSPLIRIHSECFTGETIGSMRCDCGEQLDEAIRQISLPIALPPTAPNQPPVTIPGAVPSSIFVRKDEG